jgi:hypothetical protein
LKKTSVSAETILRNLSDRQDRIFPDFGRTNCCALSTLTEYERLLRGWKTEYAPKTSEDPIDDRFVEACQMLDYTEYLADFLCAADLEEQIRAVDELMGDGLIRKLHQNWRR